MAVNYHEELVASLVSCACGNIYYELFDIEKNLPCLTYMEVSNIDIANGDTLSYSDIDYQIKVWANTVSEVQTNFAILDTLMKAQGFTRAFTTELIDNGIPCKITRYNGTGYEKF